MRYCRVQNEFVRLTTTSRQDAKFRAHKRERRRRGGLVRPAR